VDFSAFKSSIRLVIHFLVTESVSGSSVSSPAHGCCGSEVDGSLQAAPRMK